jgi:hypothetical protein
MPSEAQTRSDERARPGALYRLLDPAFGLFAWALYFLIVYVGQALACSLLPDMGSGERMLVTAALVGATLVTAGVVAIHGWRRYRSGGALYDSPFLARLAAALDALAALAVAWMLIPILLTPLCA